MKFKQSVTQTRQIITATALGIVAACANMPTQSSQITGVYVSPIKYEKLSCEELVTEQSSLARRENQLVIAQEQRVKTSQGQAFWTGVGNGDGIEASELANVRGEKEAIVQAMEKKKCRMPVGK